MQRFEELEHTADYALRAWGCDLRELIENAGAGMISLLLDAEGIVPGAWREIVVQPPVRTREGLLAACLKEILYISDAGIKAPAAFEVRALDEAALTATCAIGTVPLREVMDRIRGGIKAVTYHDLHVDPDPQGLTVVVTFDA